MQLYQVLWTCPDCGKIHRVKVPALTIMDCLSQFEQFLRLPGDDNANSQVPLLLIEEVLNAQEYAEVSNRTTIDW